MYMSNFRLIVYVSLTLAHCTSNKTENYQIYPVTDPVHHGEGPVWDPRSEKLYFVDLHHGKVLAYDFNNKTVEIAAEYPGTDLSVVLPTRKDPTIWIAGVNRNLVKIHLYDKTKKPEILCTVQDDKPKNRFNDGKTDSEGRIWIGTQGYEKDKILVEHNTAALFKFTKQNVGNPTVEMANVSISNGLTWNNKNNKFYYIDTPTKLIKEYDFDSKNGLITNERIVFNTTDQVEGFPDGMTVDENDNLWIALYAGSGIIQINPKTGDLLQKIDIPALYTTSLTWGGPKFDILFVTTSKRWLTDEQLKKQPAAGSVFVVKNLGIKGKASYLADF